MASAHTLLPPFKCGHERADDNLKPSVDGYVCRTCARAADKRYRRNSGYDKRRYLPTALENAYRRLDALENEARQYGMAELLRNPKHLHKEWDKAVKRAQAAAESQGGSIGFYEARRGVDEQ